MTQKETETLSAFHILFFKPSIPLEPIELDPFLIILEALIDVGIFKSL